MVRFPFTSGVFHYLKLYYLNLFFLKIESLWGLLDHNLGRMVWKLEICSQKRSVEDEFNSLLSTWLPFKGLFDGPCACHPWLVSKLSNGPPFTWSALLWPLCATVFCTRSVSPHTLGVSAPLYTLTGSECNKPWGISGICLASAEFPRNCVLSQTHATIRVSGNYHF